MIKRDHAKLICDIGEMGGLFTDATSLETFLQKIVEMTAEHMHADVCSIYLYYEDSRELVLKANRGLNPESIGRVRLKLGEGLTGLAVKELRPICEKNASKNPAYRYFPEIGEEAYESFLAVPIIRGHIRIGAMVIQKASKDYFIEEDVLAFRAVTTQLANTIETAKLLMSLSESPSATPQKSLRKPLKFIKGRVGSEGFACAEVITLKRGSDLAFSDSPGVSRVYTLGDFRRAVKSTEMQMEDLQAQIEETLSDVASLIFSAQILMLKDQSFIEAIVAQINEGINPPDAIVRTVENYVKRFKALPNEYLREKRHDVRDIGRRLLGNLTGISDGASDYKNKIIIAQELFPSEILKLSSQGISGVILLSGGITSHLAILARSLGIPMIIAQNNRILQLPPKTRVLIEGEQGNIYINPSEEVVSSIKAREDDAGILEREKKSAVEHVKTKDGKLITLLANINLLGDINAAKAYKASGVGLYRSEFPFMVRSDFPSEEEQFVIYKKLMEAMPGQEINFRTLDIGGDKVLSYYDYTREENPFLGMRSIRFTLKHKDIFHAQLRAILRAGINADLRIMFPMISSLDEFLEAKEEVKKCITDLKKEKVPCHEDPRIGMMIELPAVMEIIDDLARETDFFCIGTNDFIQYMLAVDRTNEKVADFYLPHHPAILRAFKRIVDAACRLDKEVTICGDMAQDVRYLPFFLGIGVRRLSLNARYLVKIQQAIQSIDLKTAQGETLHLLTLSHIHAISQHLK